MANGVYVEDPATTTIEHGVEIGAGTKILPCTVIRAGVRIGAGCEVGPFAQLRAGTVLENGAEIGNFTECKKSRIGAHAKAKHLAYLGDATIGAGTNIGAGTIFANYDGVAKHHTTVGRHSFVGSNTVLIAPVAIADGAYVGAGSALTGDVEPGQIAVARGRQRNIDGWVARERAGTSTATAAEDAAAAERHTDHTTEGRAQS
jgi:bifunctional UDP-N-acetylglucosamine pyrophosphorylase/glucosamine-1-phosphate N-acetyltransferase